MRQAALFALVGVALLAHWVLADPGYEASESQDDWSFVLLFSAAIAGLALALPVFAGIVGGATVWRASMIAASGAAVGSVANILEDGLGWGWAFWAFVLGSAVLLVGLLAMAVAIVTSARGAGRLAALVPMGVIAGLALYVVAGGPIMLATWLTASVYALSGRPPRASPAMP